MGPNNDGWLCQEELNKINGIGFVRSTACEGRRVDSIKNVKNLKRGPDSFEHINTHATAVSRSGTHAVFMERRNPNDFGAMYIGTATGSFRNSDCSHTILSIE